MMIGKIRGVWIFAAIVAVVVSILWLVLKPLPKNESLATSIKEEVRAEVAEAKKSGTSVAESLHVESSAALEAANESVPANVVREFVALTIETTRAIPQKGDLRKLDESQVHYTPEVLVRAGALIGKVSQALLDEPRLAPQGLEFYSSCALHGDYPTSLRALCYANLRDLLKKQGRDMKAFTGNELVPEEVRKIADQI